MTSVKLRAQALIQANKLPQAIALLEKSCRAKTADAHSWYLLGYCHARNRDPAKAEFCFRRSIQCDSRLPEAHSALAGILAQRRAWPEAVDHFRNALALQPDQPVVLNDLGYCLQRLRRPEEALQAYERALAINPQQALAHRNLGLLYEQLHQLDKAREHAQCALDNAPGDVESSILLAKLDTRNHEESRAVDRLKRLLQGNLKPFHSAAVNLELGKILDRCGEPAAAFEHLKAGKQILKRLYKITPESTRAYRQNIERFGNEFNTEQISDAPPSAATSGDTLIFLVGFPRSGTTLTEQILEAHPKISATHELTVLIDISQQIGQIIGRPFDYPRDIDSLDNTDIDRLRQAYYANTERALQSRIEPGFFLLDKLPLNIIHLGLIARLFPAARVLVALRDPRDVCLSCYLQSFEMNPAMSQFLDLEDTARFYNSVMNLWLNYRNKLELSYLETRYEDIVDNLEQSARRLLAFLDLDWDAGVLDFYKAARQRRVYTPSYQAVTQPVYRRSVGKWEAYQKQLAPVLPLLEPLVREFGY
jgi:tetratricopeptide (TPR) repeat protein